VLWEDKKVSVAFKYFDYSIRIFGGYEINSLRKGITLSKNYFF